MSTIIIASENFIKSNNEIRGSYELSGSDFVGFKSPFPMFHFPKMPMPLRTLTEIYSLDGKTYVAFFNGKSCAYFGTNGVLANFPAKYCQNDGWKYDRESRELVVKNLDVETKIAAKEFLGSIDVPFMLDRMLNLQLKLAKGKATRMSLKGDSISHTNLEISTAPEGGVCISFAASESTNSNGVKIPGGYHVENGSLAPGIKIFIPGNQFSDLGFLAQMSRDGANLRVTRGTNETSAVLEWTSPNWDGSVITMAQIKNL